MKHIAKQIVFQPTLKASQQYTCVQTLGANVYVRARANDGTPIYVENKYQPTYYVPCLPEHTTTKAFNGAPLRSHHCSSIWDGKDFLEKSKLPVFGDIGHEYMLLSDVYGSTDIDWDLDRLYIWDVDIEVDSEKGFAKPDDPFAEVTAITVLWRHMGKMGKVVYGCKPYTAKPDEFYVLCANESEMLLRFLEDFRAGGDYPDIVTGWNIQFYDIPYVVKRLQRLFTEDTWIRISPFERIADRTVIFNGRSQLVIDIKGIMILDYMELYKKFTFKMRDSYRLDAIAQAEKLKNDDGTPLRKLSFKEYKTLRDLYRMNYQLFIEYNIQDVVVVDKLDQKLKLIELVCALAYGAKSNFTDCFKQVRLWDIMIYHKLRADGKQIPPRKEDISKGEQYAGAYVKDPKPGFYQWVCSFDVASMYPHIIREMNLSPETKKPQKLTGMMVTGPDGKNQPSDDLVAGRLDLSVIKQMDMCLSSNGVLTDKHQEGFLPEMLKTLYDERIRFKGLQKKAKKAWEVETDPAKKATLVKQIAAYGNQQQVRKVNLNSAYGAMGSAYFRFYDIDLAEAVTVTGQMVIRRVADDINTYLNKQFGTKFDYIIASDTDSVYVNMACVAELYAKMKGEDVPTAKMVDVMNDFCEKKIMPIINKSFVDIADYMNVAVPCLSMVRDVIADKAVWTAKKHYVMNVHDSEGVRYEKPDLKMMGIDAIKSSTPVMVQEWLKKALSIFAQGGTQRALWDYITECEEKFKKASFEEIAFPRSVNNLKKYETKEKGLPINVSAAFAFNRTLERQNLTHIYEPIRDGEKIRYVSLLQPNPFHSHVMGALHGCPPEWEIEKWINYNDMFDKTFRHPLDAILTCVGWSTEEVTALW